MLTLSAPAKSPSLFVINRWDDPGAHFSRVKIPTACLIWPIWVGPIARSHIRQFILRVGRGNIRLGSECLLGRNDFVFFFFSTQLGRILSCVTLTKSFGYLWDFVCYSHTPPHTHVRCEKSSIGPIRPHFYYF